MGTGRAVSQGFHGRSTVTRRAPRHAPSRHQIDLLNLRLSVLARPPRLEGVCASNSLFQHALVDVD